MPKSYSRILVGVDGSEESKHTFKKACDFAVNQGAKLYVTTVIDSRAFATIERFDRSVVKRAEEQGSALLEDFKKEAQDRGVKEVEIILDFGSPKVRIARDIAPKYNIDLIMAGATGVNRVERVLIGSVSEAIVRQATCDVLIVRRDEDEDEE